MQSYNVLLKNLLLHFNCSRHCMSPSSLLKLPIVVIQKFATKVT